MQNLAFVGPTEPAPLLATKLYLPRPRAHLVARPRLLARLEAGLRGRLTLVAAPAGFGKTTLLADWLSQQVGRGRHVAWLSLEGADSAPVQFVRYLIAALQALEPQIGATVLPLLTSAQPPSLERLMPIVVNDLLQVPEHSLLVLDDYHVVEASAVHQALTVLVEHLPPQLHLVLASRTDPPIPLARWRVRGHVTELRAQDLRFTTDEAAAFLQEVMGLPLTAADVAAVEARTEGWIAGLQLAALSLQNRPSGQLTAFIAEFSGSHHFVVDYLVDEVLARQPASVQRFLLATSILDRLCAGLCDAVLGLMPAAGSSEQPGAAVATQLIAPAPGAESQLILEQLERANLFIVPLDDERRWYRYHHLFAQVLRERLARHGGDATQGDSIAVLHQRAGHWFAAHGLAAEAIQHALAARDWDHAARLIEEHGPLLAARGHVNAVLAWLAALPETLAAARPALDVLHGLALFFGSQLDAAELRLQAAESHLPGAPPDDRTRVVLGHIMVIRASIARYRGDLRGCIKLARQALALVPVTNALLRASPSLDVASDYVITGDVSPGNERPLVAAIAAAADTGDLQTHVTGLVLLGGFRRRQGRLREAVVAYREAAAIVSGPDGQLGLVNGAACYFRLGDVLREWNDLEAAAALLGRGHELVLGTFVTKADIVTLGYISIARLQHTRGDAAGARETLAQLHALVHERTFAPQLLVRVAAARAYLALLQGDLARAILWADTCGLAADDEYDYLREVPYLTLVRVRIAQGASDPAGPALRDAARLLDRITENATAGARMDTVVECLILRALLLQARGEGNQAVAALEDALHLAAPEGYVRVVLDEGAPMARLLMAALQTPAFGAQRNDDVPAVRAYAQQLLALLHAEDVELPVSAQDSGAVPQTQLPGGEQLTARELEVLQLLAAGRSNQAIAQELVVAIGTVKRHVNSIMGKLQVQSRLAAVAFAREQGIV